MQALVYFKPKRIAITGGYHGCHATIGVYKQSSNADLPLIGIDDEFQAGDLCWLETPLNPTGEARYTALPAVCEHPRPAADASVGISSIMLTRCTRPEASCL